MAKYIFYVAPISTISDGDFPQPRVKSYKAIFNFTLFNLRARIRPLFLVRKIK
ncbi:MAG: hypothetical protein ACTSR0_01990 [Candidatus Asgardarchaeia archaeon]